MFVEVKVHLYALAMMIKNFVLFIRMFRLSAIRIEMAFNQIYDLINLLTPM